MSFTPSQDPLVALWQTGPKPDTHHLMRDLQHLNRLHQRLNRSVFAIVCGIAIVIVFEEATGRVASHGFLSAIWITGLVIGVIVRGRAQCDRSDALTLNTVSLLKFMIARANRDLFVARCIYAGVPCGALVGYVGAKVTGIGMSPPAVAAHPHLHTLQTGTGVAALIVMIATGSILARSRSSQIRGFKQKLRSIESDL